MPEFHKLAIKYFRGEISAEEEGRLYRWVKEDVGNLAILHDWERSWADSLCLGGMSRNGASEVLGKTSLGETSLGEASLGEMSRNGASDVLGEASLGEMSQNGTSEELDEKWNRLVGHLAAREVLEDADIRIQKKKEPFRWYYIAAAAVLAILLVVSPFLFRQEKSSQLYAMEAPAGEKCRMVLPDSSVVWLNSGSRLCIADSFNHKSRNVKLIGEGYFEVKHNEKLPFIVDCNEVSVLVHGTKFNVSAYPEDRYVTTSVIEGHVSMIYKEAKVSLLRGQSARFDMLSDSFSSIDKKAADAAAWTESRFVYDNISLGELAEKLSRTYAVKFHFNSTEHINDKFNISLRNNETLDDVLNALKRIIPIKIRVEGDNIYVDKK